MRGFFTLMSAFLNRIDAKVGVSNLGRSESCFKTLDWA